MKQYVPVLSIAGSDSSGGAGIQADIKTISAIGCYAMTAITSITAQNTCAVNAVMGLPVEVVIAQLEAVWSDIPPLAVKTGMLYDANIINAVVDFIETHKVDNLVVDPVMVSTSGCKLISDEARKVLIDRLLPQALIITPNVNEAKEISGADNVEKQIDFFSRLGCRNVLLKGGDSEDVDVKTDYLWCEGDPTLMALRADAVDTKNTHGTGCTLSSAIASYLALGYDVEMAVSRAKLYVTKAISAGANVKIGKGHGPVNHFFSPRKTKYLFSNEDHNKQ